MHLPDGCGEMLFDGVCGVCPGDPTAGSCGSAACERAFHSVNDGLALVGDL